MHLIHCILTVQLSKYTHFKKKKHTSNPFYFKQTLPIQAIHFILCILHIIRNYVNFHPDARNQVFTL